MPFCFSKDEKVEFFVRYGYLLHLHNNQYTLFTESCCSSFKAPHCVTTSELEQFRTIYAMLHRKPTLAPQSCCFNNKKVIFVEAPKGPVDNKEVQGDSMTYRPGENMHGCSLHHVVLKINVAGFCGEIMAGVFC